MTLGPQLLAGGHRPKKEPLQSRGEGGRSHALASEVSTILAVSQRQQSFRRNCTPNLSAGLTGSELEYPTSLY